MTDVILFHHAQGRTAGVLAFAQHLRGAGHRVTVPDLYDGATFDSIDAGVAHAERIGFDSIIEQGVAAAEALPAASVYAGFSLGALPAQKLAQTRPGALGALLYHGALSASQFGAAWPKGVALQVHQTETDEWAELDVAEQLVREGEGELFVYPGSAHLIADSSLAEYQPAAAALILQRSLTFLGRWHPQPEVR